MSRAVELDISEIVGKFPGFRVALLVASDLALTAADSPKLEAFLNETETAATAWLGEGDLSSVPEIRSWRDAYKAFGVKKTSYRSSVERLLKNIQRGGGLPRVNALVDIYNAVSVRHRMPIGADDLDRVCPPLAFRYARTGDSFVALGDATMAPDPPKPGEIVYGDAEKCLCRRWNWYQDARSAVGPATRRAVLTVQTLTGDDAALNMAVAQLADVIVADLSRRVWWTVADANRPRAAVVID